MQPHFMRPRPLCSPQPEFAPAKGQSHRLLPLPVFLVKLSIPHEDFEYGNSHQKALYIRWIKEHKKEIAIAGVSITALVGLVLGIKNKEAMEVFWNALKNNDPKIPTKTEAPRITEQVRNIESVVIPMHREYKEPFDVSFHPS